VLLDHVIVTAAVQSIAQSTLLHQKGDTGIVANCALITSVTVFNSAGHTNSSAPVPPVLVPAVTSDRVDFSTLPATVVLALGVLAPLVSSTQAPA